MTEVRFLTEFPLSWPVVGLCAATITAWWLAHRETRNLPPPGNWLLPTLRATAMAMIMAMLLEPALHHRMFVGEPSRLQVWLDGSASMQETDQVDESRGVSRYQRSVDLISGGDIPRLETWSGQGAVEVRRFAGDETKLLWQNSPTQSLAKMPTTSEWTPEAWSRWTSLAPPLSMALSSVTKAKGKLSEDEKKELGQGLPHEPLLLLTDGRQNQGSSPLDLLNDWPRERAPVWIVGMGASNPLPRLTLGRMTIPTELFRSDRLECQIELIDHRPAGEAWEVSVHLEGAENAPPLWSQRVVSDGRGSRTVPLSFPVEPVVDAVTARNLQTNHGSANVSTMALPLVIEVRPLSDEKFSYSGLRRRQLVGVTTRRQRVLLLDGRSRWETRYLRNALERDPRWDVDAFLMSPHQGPQWFAQQNAQRPFPEKLENWLGYDLVITGEIPANAIGAPALQFIRDAVQRSGAGWIVIDGQRETWSNPEFTKLRELLPVQRQPAMEAVLPAAAKWKAVVADQASDLGALQLGDGAPTSNRAAWDRLPGLLQFVPTKLLPGGEALVELRHGAARYPMMSTRLFGAGRVVHLASDETWRWRFEVADEIHQRLWNQLARYAMRMPFAVRNDYVALDSGDVTVMAGTAVPVRALLRDTDGRPTAKPLVRAVATQNGRAVETLTLTADPELPGFFHGQWKQLPPGTYTVTLEATGFPQEALSLETTVEVVALPEAEERDVTRDEPMLRQIAERTGGHYVPEERVEEMWKKIDLESTGQVVETTTEVWQSGWWLAVATGLLGVEWWLRKKTGLI